MRHAGGACGPRRTMTSHSGDARALSGAKLTPWCEYVCLVRRVRSAFAFLLFLWGAARPYPLPPSPLRLPQRTQESASSKNGALKGVFKKCTRPRQETHF